MGGFPAVAVPRMRFDGRFRKAVSFATLRRAAACNFLPRPCMLQGTANGRMARSFGNSLTGTALLRKATAQLLKQASRNHQCTTHCRHCLASYSALEKENTVPANYERYIVF